MGGTEARLVLLGTSGGPLPSPARAGISQALVVGNRVYVVDAGSGITRQLRRARLLSRLHQVYVTHLHSDHVCDLFNLFLLGWPILQEQPAVQVHGPGPAGGADALPAPALGQRTPALVHPAEPTPGLARLVEGQLQAHAYDVNLRMRDSGRRDLASMIAPREITLPDALGARGPDRVAPEMAPIVVHQDDQVVVSTVLVEHGPVFPAFAYRFETEAGSVVFSGDTVACPNLISLATGADVLVHEVYTDDTLEQWDADQLTDEDVAAEQHLVSSHTPLSQVGKVAAAANVRRLVLTHFIPGDDDLPDEHWTAGASADFDGEVVVGHDLLELKIGG